MRHFAATAAASMAAVLLVPVGAASAAPSSLDVARAALSGLHIGGPEMPAAGSVRATHGTSSLRSGNWAGWANDNTTGKTYSALSARWVQPSITCAHNNDTEIAVFWVGIDGLSSSTVEQDGTLATCVNGVKSYFSWWEMYPTNAVQIVAPILPGDAITSKVTFKGGKYHLSVTDTTTPSGSFTRTRACGTGLVCRNSSAEWIAERPSGSSGLFVLPHFKTWAVSAAKVTAGTAGVISGFPTDRITMVNSSNADLARPSLLNANGNGFKVVWKNAA